MLNWKQAKTDAIRAATDDSGVALVAIVFIIGAAILSGIVFTLMSGSGVQQELVQTKNNRDVFTKINDAIVLYVLQDPGYLLPCPASGAAADGIAIGSCAGAPDNVGTVPWATLGLSPDDAIDGYGNQVVYAVSAGPLEACETALGVATGNVSVGTMDAGETLGTSSPFLYVLVSQGPNRFGSFSESGSTRPAPVSGEEDENCAFGSTCTAGTTSFIDTGPLNTDAEPALQFDDEIFLSDAADYATECLNFVP